MKTFYIYETVGSFLFRITDPTRKPLLFAGKTTFKAKTNPKVVVQAENIKEARKLAEPTLLEMRTRAVNEGYGANEKGFAKYTRNEGYPNQGKGEVYNVFVDEACLCCHGTGLQPKNEKYSDEVCQLCGGSKDMLAPNTFDGLGTSTSQRTDKNKLAYIREGKLVTPDSEEEDELTPRVRTRRRSEVGV